MSERTGWRDEEISNLHRTLRSDLYCVDIDWLVTEAKGTNPVALIEHKYRSDLSAINFSVENTYSSNILRNLSSMSKLPLFYVYYNNEGPPFAPWSFLIRELSPHKKPLDCCNKIINLEIYEEFLIMLRNRKY